MTFDDLIPPTCDYCNEPAPNLIELEDEDGNLERIHTCDEHDRAWLRLLRRELVERYPAQSRIANFPGQRPIVWPDLVH